MQRDSSVPRDGSAETLVGDGVDGPAEVEGIERGTVVGRYVVLDPIGRGGMGVVVAAFDPELDRKVAIKLLHSERGTEAGNARLAREAQAMARLSHPNVVTVHDVGTFADHVFVAMEFVDGVTLRAWAKAEPRAWRDVLHAMTRAGRGLAAAHAAGLVHGDFKPDNVMVGADGRLRVLDFGLARTTEELSTDESDGSATLLRKRLLVGTPGYLARECLAGGPGDARADQFAFGVTLWELLYDRLPFGGTTALELATSVLEGRLWAPPRGTKVPGWLRAVMTRALARDPRNRFATMDDLLRALERDPSRTRRRVAAVLGVTAVGAGVFAWQEIARARTEAACEAAGQSISEVWNEGRREEIRGAIESSGAGNAATTLEKLWPWLDDYASGWAVLRAQTCIEHEIDGTMTAETRRATDECLDERRLELDALVGVLRRADQRVVQSAIVAAAELPLLSACEDPRPRPDAERSTERPLELRRRLIEGEALRTAGLYDAALEVGRELQERAADDESSSAASSMLIGRALAEAGRYAESAEALRTAYFAASTVGDEEVALDAAIHLVAAMGIRLARPDEALLWADHARMLLARRGHADGLRGALLDQHLGQLADGAGRFDEALQHTRQGLEARERILGPDHPLVATSLIELALLIRERGSLAEAEELLDRALAITEHALGPDHPRLANVFNALGNVARSGGKMQAALAHYSRALTINEGAMGPDHPDLAGELSNLAITYKTIGEYQRALDLNSRALAIRERALGPDHPQTAESLQNLGLLLVAMHRHEQARPLLERALTIAETRFGPEHIRVGYAAVNLGILYQARGDLDAAATAFERALGIWERTLGRDHVDVAKALTNIAAVQRLQGHHAAARENLQRSLAIRERALGAEHPHVAYTLMDLGAVELASNHAAEAIPLLERALDIEEASNSKATVIADTRFALARALDRSKTDTQRAVQLAEQAADAYRAAGEPSAAQLAEVERWLAKRR